MSLPPLTDAARHIRDELIAAQPDGGEVLLDWDDPDGPGGIVEAAARVLDAAGVQVVQQLRREVSPRSAVDGLPIWERSLGLLNTKIAQSGSVLQRQAQVVSKLREGGPPTLAKIRDVVQAYLQYSAMDTIVILETPRDPLRAAHTYRWRGRGSIPTPPSTLTIAWTVADGPVTGIGPQVDLDLAVQLEDLSATLRAPDGAAQTLTSVGDGLYSAVRAWAQQLPAPFAQPQRGMWGFSATDIWTVGDMGTAYHYTGTWTASTTGSVAPLHGCWGLRLVVAGSLITLLWAVGDGGVILLWNGTSWTTQTSGTTKHLYGVWGTAANDVWAVGEDNTLLHYNGTAWSAVAAAATATMYGVYGTGTADIWAVGDAGVIQHWDGTSWTTVRAVVTPLRAVWVSSPVDGWAVGDSGAVYRLTRAGWVAGSLGAVTDLRAAWGTGPDDVWAGGAAASLYYWNGSTWSLYYNMGALWRVDAIWGSSPTDVWAVGDLGAWHLDAGAGPSVRLYFPGLAGAQIGGTWTLELQVSRLGGLVLEADLFVEGLGATRNWRGEIESGRGGAKFEWGVLVDTAKLGTGADLIAAWECLQRICYACRSAGLLLLPELATGPDDYGVQPDDDNAIPDQCVPG